MLDGYNTTAFLISDQEFASEHALLEQYLINRRVPVVHYIGVRPDYAAEVLEAYLQSLPAVSMCLVSYYGHGSPLGWHTDNSKDYFSYQELSRMIQAYENGFLKICASTCYGQRLIGQLITDGYSKPNCSVYTEQFRGNDVHVPRLVKDMLKAWSERRFLPEREESMTNLARHEEALAYGLPVQTFGPCFDHHFW
jgi:hypothetical protein